MSFPTPDPMSSCLEPLSYSASSDPPVTESILVVSREQVSLSSALQLVAVKTFSHILKPVFFSKTKRIKDNDGLLEKLGHLTKVPCYSLRPWFPCFLGGSQGLTTAKLIILSGFSSGPKMQLTLTWYHT